MPSKPYQEMKVLVVDDFSAMRKVVIHTITQIGFKHFNISEANNGKKAIETLTKGQFDFIISDWNMPEMTGLQFLKAVRGSKGKYKNIPFLMVTAETEKSMVNEAVKSGVSNYIIKPFSASSVDVKIKKIFK